jgi:excisionase family DNA binding protein
LWGTTASSWWTPPHRGRQYHREEILQSFIREDVSGAACGSGSKGWRFGLLRPKLPEVLDVGTTALMLMVSVDTVYNLFASGTLPARKVGRKWITTKAAILRWIENTSTDDTLARAIKRGDSDVLAEALNSGATRIKPSA